MERGCLAPFTYAECLRFLENPQLRLLDEIESEKALAAAKLSNFVSCPHCNFGYELADSGEAPQMHHIAY